MIYMAQCADAGVRRDVHAITQARKGVPVNTI